MSGLNFDAPTLARMVEISRGQMDDDKRATVAQLAVRFGISERQMWLECHEAKHAADKADRLSKAERLEALKVATANARAALESGSNFRVTSATAALLEALDNASK